MTAKNSTAEAVAKAPSFDAAKAQAQFNVLVSESLTWLQTHWVQILVGTAIGAIIVIALHALRRLGPRLGARCTRGNLPSPSSSLAPRSSRVPRWKRPLCSEAR